MTEFLQFTIPDDAFEVANSLKEEEWFDSASEAGVFAAAYAIRCHFDDIDPGALSYPNSEHNYAYNTFDPDGSWEKIIRTLYDTETPRTYFRNLIIWGLEKIRDRIQECGVFRITDFL